MDQDRRQSKQFDQAITSTLEMGQADVTTTSRPTTPLILEDIEGSNDDARDVTAPASVGVEHKTMVLLAIGDKYHDDSSSVQSFSSQEDILDRQSHDDLESDPELQEIEAAEITNHNISGSTNPEIIVNPAPIDNEGVIATEGREIEQGDTSAQDKTLIDEHYEADDEIESDGELNATVVPYTGAIETRRIVHPNGELNQAVAVTSDEEFVEEQVPHTNLLPEAIVNEVEAVEVAVPVEPDGTHSIMMLSRKDWYLFTKDNGTSLRVIQTNEDDTFKMVLQNGQEVPLTKPFPFVTTFIGKGDDYG